VLFVEHFLLRQVYKNSEPQGRMNIMDQTILLTLYQFTGSNTAFSAFAVFCAVWLPFFIVFAAALHAFLERAPHGVLRSFFVVFTPATLAYIIAATVKFLFPAMRPFAALDLTPLVLGENPLATFPSAHATFFAALGMTIFLQNRKIGWWFLLTALLIGLARIATGIHWPSDILAGFLLGGLVAFICHWASLKFTE
jgi:undecaprenyl-diphosphatase